MAGRSDALLRGAAVSAWLVVCGTVVAALVSWAARGFPPQPSSWAQGAIGVAAIALVALVYASVAAALASRSPRNPIGWIFLAIGTAMAATIVLNLSLEGVLHAVRAVPTGILLLAWGSGAMLLPGTVMAAIIALLLFPSGRTGGRVRQLAMGLGIGGFVLLASSTAMRPEGLLWYPTLPNPLGIPAEARPLVLAGSALGVLGLVASLALAALWLAQRYRHAHTTQRRQLAWVAIGASAMTVGVGLLFVARYLGTTSDAVGEVLMFVAALGSTAFALTLFRFVTVTASQGIEMDDVTFLFTDIQDSSLMYERIGDATAFDLVRLHFRALERVTRAHGGVIVKTIGDAIMARFHDPAEAVKTALEMRGRIEALAEQGTAALVLRIGLHRGPAIAVVSGDHLDYFGQTVNAAARIQAAAVPGEILLSDDVYRGVGVAEALLGHDLVAERRKLRGVSTELLLHRILASRVPSAAVGMAGTPSAAPDRTADVAADDATDDDAGPGGVDRPPG